MERERLSKSWLLKLKFWVLLWKRRYYLKISWNPESLKSKSSNNLRKLLSREKNISGISKSDICDFRKTHSFLMVILEVFILPPVRDWLPSRLFSLSSFIQRKIVKRFVSAGSNSYNALITRKSLISIFFSLEFKFITIIVNLQGQNHLLLWSFLWKVR